MRDAAPQKLSAPEGSFRVQCRERRAAVRYLSTMEASYHPVAVPTVGPSCPARIWDISLCGVGLIVGRRYEPGTLLAVVPEYLPQSLYPCLEAKVLHLSPHADGLWLAGCEFPTPLTEEQLAVLIS